MTSNQHPLWTRVILGILALLILATTLPAYINTANNPALANLSGQAASLGSVAGAFLARQLGLALIAAYGAWQGTKQPMVIGAFALGFFNLHDALFLGFYGGEAAGILAGLIIGSLASLIMIVAVRRM